MKARIEVQKRENGLRVVVNGSETGPFIMACDHLQPVLADLCCALFDKAYRLGEKNIRKQLHDIIDGDF